jgi:hypothetical protein
MGENCFKECHSLALLRFGSGDILKKIVRDMTLDEALKHLGVAEIWGRFQIAIEESDSDLEFPGWVSVADESSCLTLTRELL